MRIINHIWLQSFCVLLMGWSVDNVSANGFTRADIPIGATSYSVDELGCKGAGHILSDTQTQSLTEEGMPIRDYVLENGIIRYPGEGDWETTFTLVSRESNHIRARATGTGMTFVQKDSLTGRDGVVLDDFKGLSVEDLIEWMRFHGFWDCVLSGEDRLSCDSASHDGSWSVADGVFYFAYPEGEYCTDHKAFMIQSNTLMFTTDADFVETWFWFNSEVMRDEFARRLSSNFIPIPMAALFLLLF